jgi:hypothetical protein
VSGVGKMLMDLVSMHHLHSHTAGSRKGKERDLMDWKPSESILAPLAQRDDGDSGSSRAQERVEEAEDIRGSTADKPSDARDYDPKCSSSSSSSSRRRRSSRAPGPMLPQEMMVLVEAYMQRIEQRKRIEQESQNQKKERERAGRRRIASCLVQ